MMCVTGFYPKTAGATFDYDYYRDVHMPLVQEKLKPFGLIRMEAIRGIAGMTGAPAQFFLMLNVYFETADQFFEGLAAAGRLIMEDIPQYTTIEPTIQIGSVLEPEPEPEPTT